MRSSRGPYCSWRTTFNLVTCDLRINYKVWQQQSRLLLTVYAKEGQLGLFRGSAIIVRSIFGTAYVLWGKYGPQGLIFCIINIAFDSEKHFAIGALLCQMSRIGSADRPNSIACGSRTGAKITPGHKTSIASIALRGSSVFRPEVLRAITRAYRALPRDPCATIQKKVKSVLYC